MGLSGDKLRLTMADFTFKSIFAVNQILEAGAESCQARQSLAGCLLAVAAEERVILLSFADVSFCPFM